MVPRLRFIVSLFRRSRLQPVQGDVRLRAEIERLPQAVHGFCRLGRQQPGIGDEMVGGQRAAFDAHAAGAGSPGPRPTVRPPRA